MADEDIYSAPKAELCIETADGARNTFFPTSQIKLVSLFIATFGIYTIYWFYKNWKLQQRIMEKKINPMLRSIFYIFFTHSLFGREEESSIKKGIEKSWNAGVLATVFVILSIASSMLHRVSGNTETVNIVDFVGIVLMLILVYPLCLVQDVVNRINDDPRGMLNSSFSIYNIVFIILGVFLWLLVGVGLFQIDVEFINRFFN